VIQNPIALISEFRKAIKDLGLACGEIQHEAQPAPHRPHRLPEGKCAFTSSLYREGTGNAVLRV